MAKEPVVRQAVYSEKGYPGCMGGVPHLFDFNQALAGRRLLMTDRKRDDGLTASRNTLDVSNGGADALKSNVTLEFESRKSSKKSNGMPIKALIAQELSKELESRNRTPSVVARLMGLDALPVEQKNGMKEVKALTSELTNSWQHETPSRYTKPLQFMNQKIPVSVSRPSKESVDLKGYQQHDLDWEAQGDKRQLKATTFQNHPQEQPRKAFKRDLLARQSQKSRFQTRPSRFNEVEKESAVQQSFADERLNEAKLVNSFEEYFGPVYNGSEDKLSESKEFLDAVDFLQSNKDLLLKFLQEPNSLLAKHLQDFQSHLRSSPQPAASMKQKKGHKLPNLDQAVPKNEGSKTGLRRRDFLDPMSHKCEYKSLRQLHPDLVLEKSIIEDSLMQLLDSEYSPRLFRNQERQFAPMGMNEDTGNVDGQVPTRIVVLKPSPRRSKNHKSLHLSSPHSPPGLKESRGDFHDDADDALHELRERIKADGKAFKREDRKHTLRNVNSHVRDGLKNPREIAREIARQIRESVTRDLLFDCDTSNTLQSTLFETKERNSSRSNCSDLDEIAVSGGGETSTPFRRLVWDLQSKMGSNSILPSKYVKHPHALETHSSKGGKKRGAGRSKSVNIELADEKQLPNCVFESQQVSVHAKSSFFSVGHEKDNLDGFRRQQIFPRAGRLIETNACHDLDGSTDIPFLKSREECMDDLLRTFPRSQSVLASRSSENVELKRRMEDTVEEKAVVSSVKVNKLRANVAKQSDFMSKASGASSFTIDYQCTSNDVRGASLNSSSHFLDSAKGLSDAVNRFEFIPRQAVPIGNSSVKNLHMLNGSFAVDELHSLNKVCGAVAAQNRAFNNWKAATTALEYEDNEQQCTEFAAIKDEANLSAQHSSNNFPISTETAYHLENETSRDDLEASKEKLEQPSPVSVLDSPFQEEITSPMTFRGIRSDLHELRLRLHLLKFDNCERSQLDSECMLNEHASAVEEQLDSECMLNEHASAVEESRTKESDSCSQIVSETEPICSDIFTFDDLEHFDIKNIGLTEEVYSIGRESEMLYWGAVLIVSGFTGDSASILTRWYSPSQPLSPYLFQKMEDYCYKRSAEIEETDATANLEKRCTGQILLSVPNRHLLFDCLNEILVDILGKHLNWHPWVMPLNVCNCSMPSGKELIKLISMEAFRLLYVQSVSQDTLENLVAKDLSRGNLMDYMDDIEKVGLELEKAIFNDLIDDTVMSIC